MKRLLPSLLMGSAGNFATLDELDEESLMQIMIEPKNALAKQYQKLFEMDNVKLKFTDGSLRLIAREALERKAGARGLRGILEEIMLDVMYDLPSKENVRECIIDDEVASTSKPPVLVYETEAEADIA